MKCLPLSMLCGALLLGPIAGAQQVISLYPANAPGMSGGNSAEQRYFSKAWNAEVVANVTRPTLTLFRPPAAVKNGTAIVICPGGATVVNSQNDPIVAGFASRLQCGFDRRGSES